jgi:hypothetical protein
MIPYSIALSPEFKLLEREAQMSTILLSIAIVSFLFVGWSGMRTNGFLNLLVKNFFRLSPKEKEFKETLKINFGATLLLFLNFFIALSLCFFLLLSQHISKVESSLFALLASAVFLVIQQFGYRFVSFLSGEKEVTEAITTINRNTWQFGGILLLVLATTWTLNPKFHEGFGYSFVFLLFLMLVLRMTKGLLLSLKKRIRWYYFILYLCTLEILPAFVFIKLAFGFFQWEM